MEVCKALDVSKEILEKASKVKLLLMDVDGVLTSGQLFYVPGPDGLPAEFKAFNSQDGLGIHMLHSVGIKTGVISGRDSIATTERARILKMSHVYQGFLEKEEIFENILKEESLTAEQACFVGDDFTDAPLIKASGFGCCVGNARPELKAMADYITTASGGEGAIREIAELILKSQDQWDGLLRKYKFILALWCD